MENVNNEVIGGLTDWLGLKPEEQPIEKTAEENQATNDTTIVEKVEEIKEEIKAEVEAPKEETEPKSFLDTLTETSPEAKVEIPETIKAELEAIKAENEALKKERETLDNSDIAKLLKSGLTLEEVAKGITKVDYSNYSMNDLIKLELEKQGLKDNDLENALQEELSYYENLSPLAKSKYENEFKSNYKSEIKFEDSLKLLDEKLKENAAKFQAPDPKVYEESVKKMTQADLSEIDSKFSAMKAQNYDIQDERIEAIKAEYNPTEADLFYTDKEGKFDVNRFIKDKYLIKFGEADAKAREQAAYERGIKEAAKKYANPDKSFIGGGGEGNGKTIDQQLRQSRVGSGAIIPTDFVKSLLNN